MKVILISLLALTGFSAPEAHDVAMAVFRLSATETGLELTINFDREDYFEVTGLAPNTTDQAAFQAYLDQTTNWIINGKKQLVRVEELVVERAHIQVNCSLPRAETSVRQIQLQNEFLLAVDRQSNVIMLELNGASRGFRMHDGRKEISVEY